MRILVFSGRIPVHDAMTSTASLAIVVLVQDYIIELGSKGHRAAEAGVILLRQSQVR